MKKIAFGILSAALIGGAQAAAAATLSYSDSFGMTSAATTDWTHTLNLSQFDSSLGTLQSVLVTLTGLVEGEASAESLNASPSTVKLNLSAVISAMTAGGVLVETLPIVSETYHFTAYDGSMNFAGTSGAASGTLTETGTDSQTRTGADLSEFIGTGTIAFSLAADGQSYATGAGNLLALFIARAGAQVSVLYTYEPEPSSLPPVPLPATAPLLLGGLGVLALRRRRQS